MQNLVKIAIVLVVISAGYVKAQDYLLEQENLELNDINIWDDIDDKTDTDSLAQQTLSALCQEYDLAIENTKIDCKNIELIVKSSSAEEHVIKRREAEDSQLEEGSGAGESQNDNTTVPSEPQKEENPTTPQTSLKEVSDSPLEARKLPEANPETVTARASENKETAAKKEAESSETPIVTNPKEQEAPAVQEESQAKPAEEKVVTTKSEEESATKQEETSTPPPKESHPKGRKLAPPALPSDLAEEEEHKKKAVATKEDDKNKDHESVDEKQSANAVISLKEPKEAPVVVEGSDTDKLLKKIEPDHASSTGESSEDVQKSGKDTKILIFLVIAVVAIGLMAFTYNFIKKRKQRQAREERDEETGFRRSLQNLTTNGNGKAAAEVEMKPLMNNAEKRSEFSDDKENGKCVENKEKQ